MTKFIGIATVIVGLTLSASAFAADPPTPPTPTTRGNSEPGIDRYLANPGRQQATEVGAQCGSGAGSGAFGFLGTGASEAGGADGVQTGINNSGVCGNN
jgi:hypothetical protein